jgi:F-type H+-transporting ATPase subunit epsilon
VATTHFELVSPTATLYSGEAEMIVCKTVDGEIAFLADHMPYIGALDPAAVRIVGPESGGGPAGEELRFAVRGGFVEVKSNQVIMLADLALTPAEVDVTQAERDEQDAGTRAASGPEPDKAAERDLKWAQARLEVARS